uniref:Uncharacterized protein n=1 Tax=Timema poppense TaxID=170557 RepID=A0A7R9H653_TIMPO|nr:unnamed protein product [Timema poppensis]
MFKQGATAPEVPCSIPGSTRLSVGLELDQLRLVGTNEDSSFIVLTGLIWLRSRLTASEKSLQTVGLEHRTSESVARNYYHKTTKPLKSRIMEIQT